jgi:hypothetical protein
MQRIARAIDRLIEAGGTVAVVSGLAVAVFLVFFLLSQFASGCVAGPAVDCSGCPRTADACLCPTVVPTPDHGWFPCTLSNGVQAMCSIGGAAYSPAYSVPAAGGLQLGWNITDGSIGLGLGAEGINLVPLGAGMGGYE